MRVYLNDKNKSVDPRLHLKRVDITDRNHCASCVDSPMCHRLAGSKLFIVKPYFKVPFFHDWKRKAFK